MKKILLLFIILFVQYIYPNDLEEIIKRGEIIVGMYYKDMPPFFYKENGKLRGIDVEIIKGIAKELNVKVVYDRKSKNYQELYNRLVNNEFDIVCSKFSRTLERAKNIRYTTPYVYLKQALLVNRIFKLKYNLKNNPIAILKNIKFRIGVKEKTSYVGFAKSLFIKAEIIEYKEWEDVVNAIKKGKIDVALYDDNEIMKLVYKNPELALFAHPYIITDKKDAIAIGVNYKKEKLVEWLNIYLDTKNYNYNVDKLIKKFPKIYKGE